MFTTLVDFDFFFGGAFEQEERSAERVGGGAFEQKGSRERGAAGGTSMCSRKL